MVGGGDAPIHSPAWRLAREFVPGRSQMTHLGWRR
jgi:hypothetical protein